MKRLKGILISGFIASALVCSSCTKTSEPDTEYPVIDLSFNETYPVQCSELMRGDTITFKARFTDNAELGGYSLDVHHNFDHHTHSTEINDCDLDPEKEAVNPMLLIESYTIPSGLQEYVAEQTIVIPTDVDTGDYHFSVLLTDYEGWQTIKGLSIKIN